uniref:Uncharacterized protein n=1 Tax=Pipistrellus kuhlii TaxID=59472 RepID=A0A7J7Y9E0_PIPKU|nr:hypothetical protein mPipKuh1_010292 [Pipistrellus kuhlii]
MIPASTFAREPPSLCNPMTVPLLPIGVWVPRVSWEMSSEQSGAYNSLWIERSAPSHQTDSRASIPLFFHAYAHLTRSQCAFLFPSSCRTSTRPAFPWFWVSFSCSFDVVVRGSMYRCIPYAALGFSTLRLIK